MTRTTGTSFRRKLVGTALAVVAGLGAVVVTSSPALAASCTLSFTRVSANAYRLNLSCPNATPAGALQLWAEDFPFDQFIGNTFQPGQLVDRGILNEDDSWFNQEDESYAKLSVRESNGAITDVRTNTVSQEF